MPEGDTIHRHAARLRPLLVGQVLVGVYRRGQPVPALAGARVTSVEPRGKHLLIALDRGAVIHVHLGMNGSWRRARRPLPEGFALRAADLALVTDADVLLCRARTVELLRAAFVHAHPELATLGPDLLAETVDLDEIVARARRGDAARPVAELLLDQQVAAGIGNIWRNEALFLEGVHPHTPVGALDDDALRRLYARARALMRAPRRRLQVYRRRGRPCPVCGAPIAAADLRQSFWCPTCQPIRGAAGPGSSASRPAR